VLKQLQCLGDSAAFPLVMRLSHIPTTPADVDQIFDSANVVVSRASVEGGSGWIRTSHPQLKRDLLVEQFQGRLHRPAERKRLFHAVGTAGCSWQQTGTHRGRFATGMRSPRGPWIRTKISGVRVRYVILILHVFLRNTVSFDQLEINCLERP
jgi:hypothetical protein